MSSCIKPMIKNETNPVILLHCFDSSCLEWRCTYPLLEEAGLEAWPVDVLGWGFSNLEKLPPCNVAAKRYHLYELWKSRVKRPMILVGPSLGAAAAIDFAINHPEAVGRLHSQLPWWKDATVNFMLSGGYNVVSQIKQVKHKTLIICGEHQQKASSEIAL